MTKRYFLILICGSVLFVFFQNFSVPNRVLPIEKRFESRETSPQKRIRDYVKFQVGDEVANSIANIKSKLQINLGGRAPAQEDESEVEEKSTPVDYTFANFRTIRIRDDDKEIKCRVDSKGLNIAFEQKLSSTSSYVIEHNTEQQKSQAKFQISW